MSILPKLIIIFVLLHTLNSKIALCQNESSAAVPKYIAQPSKNYPKNMVFLQLETAGDIKTCVFAQILPRGYGSDVMSILIESPKVGRHEKNMTSVSDFKKILIPIDDISPFLSQLYSTKIRMKKTANTTQDKLLIRLMTRIDVELAFFQNAVGKTGPAKGTDFSKVKMVHKNSALIENTLKMNGRLWKQVHNFDNSGPNDQHYIIDRSLGIIVFGDGINGKVPHTENENVVTTYRNGGGEMPQEIGMISSLHVPPNIDKVSNPLPASGGSESETVSYKYVGVRMQQGKVLVDNDWNTPSPHSKKYCGIYRATVTDNADPLKHMRLEVMIPDVSGRTEVWALPCIPVGSSLIPKVDDEVWVEFEGGDPNHPVWMGTLK